MEKHTYGLSLDPFGIHQKIILRIKPGEKVLEVGCSSGYLTRELVLRGALVTGIEFDRQEGQKAKKYCQRLIIGDIENPSTLAKLGSSSFDCILIADVLEHLRYPKNSLKALKRFLKKDGEVIISVPNIAFVTNRLTHLFGRFEYTQWGIMDKTHIRFFTKATILELVHKAGLRLTKFDYVGNFTQLPLYMQTLYPLFGQKRWWRRVEYKLTCLWPEGLATQFLLICTL